MDKRTFKDGLFGRLAEVAKALASPKRVELVELVAQCERSVEWLAVETGMSVANTSQHLQILRTARLVDSRKRGLYVLYRVAGPDVAGLLGAVRLVAERRDGEIDRLARAYFGDRDDLEPVRIVELLERVRTGAVVLVDVRPAEEYAAAHIAGARSAPLDALDALAADLPTGTPVVAYCRGPYCVFADQAVERLRALGFDARRLDGGFPEWWAAGLPIERAT